MSVIGPNNMYNDCIFIKDIRPGLKNINVVFIVLEVGSAKVTKENREVRNFKVADSSAAINVSVWDEPGKLLIPGDIVRLTKGYASIFRHCLTLYSGKNGEISKIGDFCLIFNEQLNMSDPSLNIVTNPMGNPNQQLGSVNNGASNNGTIIPNRQPISGPPQPQPSQPQPPSNVQQQNTPQTNPLSTNQQSIIVPKTTTSATTRLSGGEHQSTSKSTTPPTAPKNNQRSVRSNLSRNNIKASDRR